MMSDGLRPADCVLREWAKRRNGAPENAGSARGPNLLRLVLEQSAFAVVQAFM
jgi:hypothetical protein